MSRYNRMPKISRLTVISFEDDCPNRQTRTWPSALPEPLNWSVKIKHLAKRTIYQRFNADWRSVHVGECSKRGRWAYELMSMSMSMWSLRWHFTKKSVTGAPYSTKSYSLSHSWTPWWRVRWLKQCRLEVAAELQQRWRRTNRRRKSIPARAAVTGKARSPSVVRRVDGMTSVDVEALRRRRQQLSGKSQQGMTAPCRWGNDTREHITTTRTV